MTKGEKFMEYVPATESRAECIYNLVQTTIKTIYPRYYPQEVVDFFCRLHCKENILRDIQAGGVGVLTVDGRIVGTGSYRDDHITRVYVHPSMQGKGYGSFIMQQLEDKIARDYAAVTLDASLPASRLYEHRGYKTIEHKIHPVENGVVLVYEIMEKKLGRGRS